MRTLVLGIPLPHLSFDNYSFMSAPSLFDYSRVVVDMSAVSNVVQEVVDGSSNHETLGGQAVVNGPTAPDRFSLSELLLLRRLEAERLLDRGGVLVCFAYPDVAHEGIAALPGWRLYDWLPAPERFSYARDLLAGYGKMGAEATEEGHAFTAYINEFALRLGFRAHVAEDSIAASGARVFARSPGGAAIGVELPVRAGRVVLLPPIDSLDYSRDRPPLASTVFDCLETMQPSEMDAPRLIRKEAS